MNADERKKTAVITKYISETFSQGDWVTLGQITGCLPKIHEHPRLLRSFSFGDDDYSACVAEVLDKIFSENLELIEEVVDHFDIDLWFQQKEPEKHKRIFSKKFINADFWTDGYFKIFVSHISSNRKRMSALKIALSYWGVSAFIAHEDIQASREWREEVEAGLLSMDTLVAVVEPGFKESDWCAQEVGYALGRGIDVIPLMAGLDPFGFFGKFQGIQIKGKLPDKVAEELVRTILKKNAHQTSMLNSLGKATSTLQSDKKIKIINELDSWSIISDMQIKSLIEQSGLSDYERKNLKSLILRVGAFQPLDKKAEVDDFDDIPF